MLRRNERSEGLPMPREPALLPTRSQDGEAKEASSERMPRWHPRTSGDGAWAAPSGDAEQRPHGLRRWAS